MLKDGAESGLGSAAGPPIGFRLSSFEFMVSQFKLFFNDLTRRSFGILSI
jgi:hypothetical protein